MIATDRFETDCPGADPALLWALLSDTDRLSEALQLAPGTFRSERWDDARLVWVGRGRQLGLALEWTSGPDSWVAARWYRAVREYRRGPVRRSCIDFWVDRSPLGCAVRVERTLVGGPAALLYDRWISAPAIRRFVRASGKRARVPEVLGSEGSPFTALQTLPPPKAEPRAVDPPELALRLAKLREIEPSGELSDKLAEVLREGSVSELADLSPLRLADRWRLPRREVIRMFLRATHVGLLELRWGLRCQVCQVAAETRRSLTELPDRVECPGCGLSFALDLASHTEATFGVPSALRGAPRPTYCLAGAPLRPHVFAQLVVTPEEPCTVSCNLPRETSVRVLGLPRVGVVPAPAPARLRVRVGADGVTLESSPESAGKGPTELTVECQAGRQAVVFEPAGWSVDWVSAALLATVPELHSLFSSEAPRHRQEVSVGSITLLFSDLRGSTAMYQRLGDAPAFNVVQDHFEQAQGIVEACGGALVKTMGDAVMAVFQSAPSAVQAALTMQRALSPETADARGLGLKIGIHSGVCLAVRANERLDFFGHAVNLAARAQAQSQGGEVVVTAAVLEHPEVAALLAGVPVEPFEAHLKGIEAPQQLFRFHPRAPA